MSVCECVCGMESVLTYINPVIASLISYRQQGSEVFMFAWSETGGLGEAGI